MFIATIVALSGLSGGLASMLAGRALEAMNGMSWELLGRVWGGYNLVFFASFLLRLVCVAFAHKIDNLSVTELHLRDTGWHAAAINHRP